MKQKTTENNNENDQALQQPQPSAGVPEFGAKHYSPHEVAQMWGVSEQTVRRLFQDEQGVLKLVSVRSGRRGARRGYTTLRIPEAVLERVYRRLRGT